MGTSGSPTGCLTASLELLLFSGLQQVPITPRGMERVRERTNQLAPGLVERLGFQMYLPSDFAV